MDFVDDDSASSRERIEKLLIEQNNNYLLILNKLDDICKRLDHIESVLPLSEDERIKNRFIRGYAKTGIPAPFFPHRIFNQ